MAWVGLALSSNVAVHLPQNPGYLYAMLDANDVAIPFSFGR